jgi:hypothetical protein
VYTVDGERIKAVDGRIADGQLVGLRRGEQFQIPLSDISRLSAYTGSKWAWGAAIGAAVGATVSAFILFDIEQDPLKDIRWSSAGPGSVGLTLLTSGIGSLVGLGIRSWEDVPVRSLGHSSRSTTSWGVIVLSGNF